MTCRRLIHAAVRLRYWLLAVATIAGIAAAVVGGRLALDRSIENMFAADDPILEPYRRLQRTFGQHEIILAIYEEPSLTASSGRQRIDDLSTKLRSVDGVVAAISLLDLPNAADFDDEQIGKQFREVFAGYTHNTELTAAGVLCLIDRPTTEGTPRRETLAGMRAVINDLPGGQLVGEPVLIEEAFDLLDADGDRLNTWCTALVLATIFVCFRRLRWILLPLAVVQLTLAATRATLVLGDVQLSMVSSMLAAIVTVVAVATVVHVIVRYQRARGDGLAPRAAVSKALRQLAWPVTFTCLTDMAGFASLMISEVGPVHDFGMMMAIGSMWVLPICLLVAPGVMLLNNHGDSIVGVDSALTGALAGVLAWSQRHAVSITIAGFALTAFAVLGTQRLERETVFTKNFRAGSHLVESYEFVEKEFGGAGVWDLQIPAPKRFTRPFLMDILAFEQQLRAEAPQLTKAISLVDSLDAVTGGIEKRRGFGSDLAIRAGMGGMRKRIPEFVDATYHADTQTGEPWLRVMLRAPESLGAAEKTALIEQVAATAKQKYPQSEVTGYYVLLNKLIESVLADQWKAFGIAAAAILLMMTVAFRSLPLALAAMVPNTLPVLVLFGAMGWLGLRINMGAAMIAAVSVGLSVDGSIHYIMDYRRLRRRGLTVAAALAEVQNTVGRAATLATLALVVGFATLATSDFVPTIYFGVLVSLSMIGGLAGNLAVLPMLISAVDRGSR